MDMEDLIKIVKSLPNKTNTSPDGVPHIFIKNCIWFLYPALLHVFQFSLYSGTVSDILKKAIIIPVKKCDPPNVIANYRPISLTSSFSIIIERRIYDALYAFLTRKNLMPNSQHGFRSGKSTITQLLETFDEITSALDNGYQVDLVYFDFQKAFDSIPPHKLLHKLKRAGVAGALLKWLTEFLTNRTFRVKVENHLSEEQGIDKGVPQGSRLGPLLFIFYVHDIPGICHVLGVKLKMYADDLKAYIAHSNKKPETDKLQKFIDKLSEYADNEGLKLQPAKCSIMYLGTKNRKTIYSLHGINLPSHENVRDLGLYVSSNLKWDGHIRKVSKRAISRLYLLFKAVRSTDPNFLTRMYLTYVVPLLDYGSCIFNSNSKQNAAIIERVQRIFTRNVFSRCYNHSYPVIPPYEERLKILSLPSLSERLLKADLILYHKIITNEIAIETQYPVIDLNPTRTNPRGIYRPKAKRDFRKNFFLSRIPSIYLKLPATLVNSSLEKFTDSIKRLQLKNLLSDIL